MRWYAWAILALLAANVIVVILGVGKPRRPLTQIDAVVILIANSLVGWGVISLATS